jgi:hypothetical protein
MWLRAQRAPHPVQPKDLDGAAASTTTLHPDAVAWDDYDARFAIGVRLPDVTVTFVDADDGSDDFTFWALAGPSWARVDVADKDHHRVWQYGPRRLWDEIEAAYQWWHEAGRPKTERFGLTVEPQRQQGVWLDAPDNWISI